MTERIEDPLAGVDWSRESDEEVAARLDRPVQTVAAARRARGYLRRRDLTDEDRAVITLDYPAGVPVAQIAATLGRSTDTVYTLAREMGLQRPGGSGTGRPRQR